MKNSFFALTKASLQSLFPFFRTKKATKKTKGAVIGVVFAILAMYLGIMGSVFSSTLRSASLLKGTGFESSIMLGGLIQSTLLVFVFTVAIGQGLFFSSKENETLFSLPIRTSTILLSKIVSLLLFIYAFSFIMLLPAVVGYFVAMGGVTTVGIIMAISVLIVAPLLPFSISLLIASLISLISSISKMGPVFKNIISSIITICVTLGVTLLLSFPGQGGDAFEKLKFMVLMPGRTLSAISGAFDPMMLLYVAINIISVVLVSFIMSTYFKKLVQRPSKQKSRRETRPTEGGEFGALFRKDVTKYFSSSPYLTNTIIGAVMLLAFSILICFSSKITSAITSLATPLLICVLISSLCLSLSNTTGVSISIEGKKIELMKSLPISQKKFIFSKIILNFVILLPFFIISSIIFSIFFKFNYYEILILFFGGILVIACQSVFGIFANFKFPKFDFTNETYVVKQSASAFLSMMLIPFVTIILFTVYLTKLSSIISPLLFLGIYFSIIFAVFSVFSIILIKNSKKYFNKLNL